MGSKESNRVKEPSLGRKAAYFARNEAALIHTAQYVLGEIGWGAKISEVSKTARVAPSTIYMHFETKDALFDAAAIAAMEDWENWAHAQLAGITDPFELLVTPMRLFVRVGETHNCFGKLVAKNFGQLSKRLPQLLDSLIGHVHELGSQGLLKVDHMEERVRNLVAVLVNALERQLANESNTLESADRSIEIALPMIGISEAEAARLVRLPLPISSGELDG